MMGREAYQDEGPHGPDVGTLTPREKEVLQLAMWGKPRNAVAHALGMSEDTVDGHMHMIFERLGAGGIVEAIAKAIQSGQIPCYCGRQTTPTDGSPSQ